MENFLHDIDHLTARFALITVLLPLAAAVLNMLLPGRRNKLAGWISSAAILVGATLAAMVFTRVWNGHEVHEQVLWFTIGDTRVYAGLWLNNLSVLMLLLVNLIALPVHIYSIAYMKHDENYKRYFAYLSFFCFSMLALVITDNLALFYVFWELVGFSSYLLIGFWFTREKAVQANKKAFIINRIGDAGLLVAILILFAGYHTFDITKLFGNVSAAHAVSYLNHGVWLSAKLPVSWQYIACAGIFLAVAAKSAQFPLHTWLPDAMSGPTCISALIHAATMVAAGVFLLGRVFPLFNDMELTILAVVGCFTAFMAATIALTQNDLKRILAYSTISQLGYMVMAMGAGAYASSLFHLATHAFFKCLLFLVAGIVIHQMEHIQHENDISFDAQNIQYMGGLRKSLPFTFIAALIGGWALVGLPLSSGYLSKDSILIQTFVWADGKAGIFEIVPIFGLLTAGITAFYVARLIIKVFMDKPRFVHFKAGSLHVPDGDGGLLYKIPLGFLALCSLFPLFSPNLLIFERSWMMSGFRLNGGMDRGDIYHTILPAVTNALILAVIGCCYVIYIRKKNNPFPQKGFLYNFSFGEWYINDAQQKLVVKPVITIGRALFWYDRRVIDGIIHLLVKTVTAFSRLAAWVDHNIIDGFLNLLALIVKAIGSFFRRFQGGKVQYYLFSMLAVLLALFIIKSLI